MGDQSPSASGSQPTRMVTLAVLFALTSVLSAILLVSGPPREPDQVLSVRVSLPSSLDTLTPLWATAEFRAGPGLVGADDFVFATLFRRPRFLLRNRATGEEVPRLTVLPSWETGLVVGSLPIDFLSFAGSGGTALRYPLNRVFGAIPPAEYELTAEFYLTLPVDRTVGLPGREAPELGIISTGGSVRLVHWALPEQKVSFRVARATGLRQAGILARVRRFLRQDRAHHVATDDWLSLLLMNDQSAWDLLNPHLDQLPEVVSRTACMFLLNYGTDEEAVQWVFPLLLSKSCRVARIAMEVISQRGEESDAVLLRGFLKNVSTRREAFITISEMLHKPLPADLGRRPLSDEDVKTALGWLAALPGQAVAPGH